MSGEPRTRQLDAEELAHALAPFTNHEQAVAARSIRLAHDATPRDAASRSDVGLPREETRNRTRAPASDSAMEASPRTTLGIGVLRTFAAEVTGERSPSAPAATTDRASAASRPARPSKPAPRLRPPPDLPSEAPRLAGAGMMPAHSSRSDARIGLPPPSSVLPRSKPVARVSASPGRVTEVGSLPPPCLPPSLAGQGGTRSRASRAHPVQPPAKDMPQAEQAEPVRVTGDAWPAARRSWRRWRYTLLGVGGFAFGGLIALVAHHAGPARVPPATARRLQALPASLGDAAPAHVEPTREGTTATDGPSEASHVPLEGIDATGSLPGSRSESAARAEQRTGRDMPRAGRDGDHDERERPRAVEQDLRSPTAGARRPDGARIPAARRSAVDALLAGRSRIALEQYRRLLASEAELADRAAIEQVARLLARELQSCEQEAGTPCGF